MMLLALAIAPNEIFFGGRWLSHTPGLSKKTLRQPNKSGAPSASSVALRFGAPKMYAPSTWDKVCSSTITIHPIHPILIQKWSQQVSNNRN